MRHVRWAALCAALVALATRVPVHAAEPPSPVEARMLDGSVVKGVVTARSAEDVTIRTDYGVLRIPATQLSAESRRVLLGPMDPAACAARVRELEGSLRALEEENQDLRRRLLAAQQAPSAAVPRTLVGSDAPARSSAGRTALSYSLSSTGKRHNSSCRYYEPDRACGSGTGVACKVCGG